jgi:hypothetical protein
LKLSGRKGRPVTGRLPSPLFIQAGGVSFPGLEGFRSPERGLFEARKRFNGFRQANWTSVEGLSSCPTWGQALSPVRGRGRSRVRERSRARADRGRDAADGGGSRSRP